MLLRLFVVLFGTTLFGQPVLGQETATKPLRALLIAGGCCHDYARQQEALCKGIQSRANVQVDVYWTDNSTTTPVLPLYSKLNWADEYDVIIHDECAADIKDPAILNRILQTHQRIPAGTARDPIFIQASKIVLINNTTNKQLNINNNNNTTNQQTNN